MSSLQCAENDFSHYRKIHFHYSAPGTCNSAIGTVRAKVLLVKVIITFLRFCERERGQNCTLRLTHSASGWSITCEDIDGGYEQMPIYVRVGCVLEAQ